MAAAGVTVVICKQAIFSEQATVESKRDQRQSQDRFMVTRLTNAIRSLVGHDQTVGFIASITLAQVRTRRDCWRRCRQHLGLNRVSQLAAPLLLIGNDSRTAISTSTVNMHESHSAD